jgi:hypothetical protein
MSLDRHKFTGSPCSCRPKMQHDLSRCLLDGHHGVFGVVRQIGSQRLRNYHQERDKAAGRNIVLESLPEDEQYVRPSQPSPPNLPILPSLSRLPSLSSLSRLSRLPSLSSLKSEGV